MLSTVLYYELAMKVPIPVGITVYLLTWGLGHLRCLVHSVFHAVLAKFLLPGADIFRSVFHAVLGSSSCQGLTYFAVFSMLF